MSEPPPKLDVNDLQTYRAHWQRVGPILARIRRRELRALTPKEHQRALFQVMQLARPHEPSRKKCGLIEFYRRLRS
jgi:hypothetical protein